MFYNNNNNNKLFNRKKSNNNNNKSVIPTVYSIRSLKKEKHKKKKTRKKEDNFHLQNWKFKFNFFGELNGKKKLPTLNVRPNRVRNIYQLRDRELAPLIMTNDVKIHQAATVGTDLICKPHNDHRL